MYFVLGGCVDAAVDGAPLTTLIGPAEGALVLEI